MRLPDPARSQVILIGTAAYETEAGLPDLPAVAHNLDDLHGALADPTHGWLTPQACTRILNPTSPDQLGVTLAEQAARAEDLVLIYYAGHGLLSPRGELYLATSRTHRERLRFTAFSYDGIREILNDSPAANRVVILDCCYSGRAIAAMTDPQSTAYDQLDITGTYILTSTTATTTAHAPEGARHTAFTGELITLLRAGDPDIPDLITLDHIYRATNRSLIRRGLPRPQQRGSNATPHLALTRNPALDHQPSTEATGTLVAKPPAVIANTPVLDIDKPDTAPQPTPPVLPVPNRHHRGAGLAVVATAQLLVAVFGALVAWSPSYIEHALGLSRATGAWLDLAYVLAFVIAVSVAGRLGDVLGHRRLFRSALVVISAAALLAGTANVGGLLLAAFALAGMATACVTANGLALQITAFCDAPGRAVAVFIAVTGGGAAIGVPTNTAVLESSNWRLMYWWVIPLAAVIALAGRVLHQPARQVTGGPLARATVPTIGIGLLAFGLLFSDRDALYGGLDTMSSPAAWGPLIAAAVILGALAIIRGWRRATALPYAMVFVGAALATLAPTITFLSGLSIADIYLPVGVGLPVGTLLALVLVGRVNIRTISVLGGLAGAAAPFLTALLAERHDIAPALTALGIGGDGRGRPVVLRCDHSPHRCGQRAGRRHDQPCLVDGRHQRERGVGTPVPHDRERHNTQLPVPDHSHNSGGCRAAPTGQPAIPCLTNNHRAVQHRVASFVEEDLFVGRWRTMTAEL